MRAGGSSPKETEALRRLVRQALAGRGRNAEEARKALLAHRDLQLPSLLPVLLGVRDDLATRARPPKRLDRRFQDLLLALGTGADGKATARRRARPARRPPRPADRAGRLLRALLAEVPEAVLALRSSGRVALWNRAGVELTGRRLRQLVAKGPGCLFPEAQALEGLRTELESEGVLEPREMRLRRVKGREVPVRVLGRRVGPPDGQGADPIRHLILFHDLTEVHRIRERLIDTEKLSAMAKIAGSVAHEFRNPLNSLFLATDLLEDELHGSGAPEKTIAPTLATIREEIERLNQIITHYLSLSKIDSPTREVVDLGEAVEEFAREWRERAEQAGVDLRVRSRTGDLKVSADPNQIHRVLVNLVENAFDALREEKGDKTVRLAVRPMRRTVKLTVQDNGPGIPDEIKGRVFEPFFTSRARGSGLGLYLVREIMLAHEGAIALAANGGKGTAVVLHWPRAGSEKA